MSKLIIVEGPDSSGKSTLAKFIALHMPAMYIHATGHKSLHVAMQAYHESLLCSSVVNLKNGHNVVMDRFWPSEHVYGQVLRPCTSAMNYKLATVVEAVDAHPDVTYIFCMDPLIQARYKEEHVNTDHQYTESEFAAIVGEYRVLREEFIHPKILDYSLVEHGSDLAKFMEEI